MIRQEMLATREESRDQYMDFVWIITARVGFELVNPLTAGSEKSNQTSVLRR